MKKSTLTNENKKKTVALVVEGVKQVCEAQAGFQVNRYAVDVHFMNISKAGMKPGRNMDCHVNYCPVINTILVNKFAFVFGLIKVSSPLGNVKHCENDFLQGISLLLI